VVSVLRVSAWPAVRRTITFALVVPSVLSVKWSVERGVWSVECGVWSLECGVWSVLRERVNELVVVPVSFELLS
jgi:hypothetical protein